MANAGSYPVYARGLANYVLGFPGVLGDLFETTIGVRDWRLRIYIVISF